MPKEFTISFWVRPIALNVQSYFFNAFSRILVKAVSSSNKVYFSFVTGTSTTVDPVYPVSPNDYKQ